MKFPQSLYLIEDFKKSSNYNLIRSIESVKKPYKIFSGNYLDLKNALLEHQEKSDNGSMWEDNQLRWEIQDKLTRLMYNFFSSAFTLVYHTRNHNRKLHKPNTIIAIDYQHFIDNNFANDPLHCFVIDFRNFLCHSALPNFTSIRRSENGSINTTFRVNKASFQGFKWEPVAKDYIESLPDTFDLEEIVDSYFNKVQNLHEWYRFKQLQFYKDIYAKVISEKKALLRAATEDGIIKALPFNQADIEQEDLILKSL